MKYELLHDSLITMDTNFKLNYKLKSIDNKSNCVTGKSVAIIQVKQSQKDTNSLLIPLIVK